MNPESVNSQFRQFITTIQSATWRQDFGGTIYQTQGTDGDIELPQNSAQTVYNNIEVGFPVVIY